MSGIRNRFDPRSILFEPIDREADVAPLREVPGVEAVRRDGQAWEVALGEGTHPADVIRGLAAAVPSARVEIRRPTLEDVFVSIVTGAPAAASEDGARLREALRENGGLGAQ
jgi:hypothetical protein